MAATGDLKEVHATQAELDARLEEAHFVRFREMFGTPLPAPRL